MSYFPGDSSWGVWYGDFDPNVVGPQISCDVPADNLHRHLADAQAKLYSSGETGCIASMEDRLIIDVQTESTYIPDMPDQDKGF